MNILDEIVSKKRTRVSEAKSIVSIEDIQNQLAKSSSLKSNFKKNLENQAQAIIAEIKKASPSAGIIAEDFNPILKAQEYEKMGARALSILTAVNIDNALAPIFSYSCAFKIGLKSSAIIPALGDAFLISAIIACA